MGSTSSEGTDSSVDTEGTDSTERADTGGVVGKIKAKASAAAGGLLGKDDSVADEDPDMEYEPTPDQRVLEGGMVVLSESQAQESDGEQGSGD